MSDDHIRYYVLKHITRRSKYVSLNTMQSWSKEIDLYLVVGICPTRRQAVKLLLFNRSKRKLIIKGVFGQFEDRQLIPAADAEQQAICIDAELIAIEKASKHKSLVFTEEGK